LDKEPPQGVVRAWTDGLEREGIDGRKYAGYGVWLREGHCLNASEKLLGLVQTNNRAEMTAVLYVLKRVPKWVPLQICTDSQLVVDMVLERRLAVFGCPDVSNVSDGFYLMKNVDRFMISDYL